MSSISSVETRSWHSLDYTLEFRLQHGCGNVYDSMVLDQVLTRVSHSRRRRSRLIGNRNRNRQNRSRATTISPNRIAEATPISDLESSRSFSLLRSDFTVRTDFAVLIRFHNCEPISQFRFDFTTSIRLW